MTTIEKHPFTVHDVVALDHDVSLAKIGELTASQLAAATAAFTDCEPFGWESDLTEVELSLGNRFHFDVNACITDDEDFVLFGFTRGEQKKQQLDILMEHYPKIADLPFGVLCCDSYFAHSHNDKETTSSAGQLMLVIENEAQHKLYSKDSSSIEHILVPKKGDVVFLNVWCEHAVLPDQSRGIDFMRNNGMKLVCFSLD